MMQFLTFLPLFFILLIFWHMIIKRTKYALLLPPGPLPLPIIGNILQLVGSNPHVRIAELAKSYGPLISLKLGSQLLVVGSSPEAAMQILKTNDRILSGRKAPHVAFARDPLRNHVSMIWAFECTGQWKVLRKLVHEELFSPKVIENQSCFLEKKIKDLIQFIRTKEGVPIKIVDVIDIFSSNFLGEIFFSNDKFTSFDEIENGGHGMSSFIKAGFELCGTPNISDIYPALGSLDIQGLERKAGVFVNETCRAWAKIVVERRESRSYANVSSNQRDFLDVLLQKGFTDDQINTLFMELLIAGSHTATCAIEWAMAEIIKNQNVLHKICIELDREISSSSTIVRESDLARLPYLNAVVKETLRLHPPAPLLFPHCATETCNVMNYTIPKDALLVVNIWAIGRDPNVWENPTMFNPERFLENGIDFKTKDFKYMPFGAGRRICPAIPMATRHVELTLANLFRCFDWSLPNGTPPHELNMREQFVVALDMEQPLVLVATPKYKWLINFAY